MADGAGVKKIATGQRILDYLGGFNGGYEEFAGEEVERHMAQS